MKFGVIAFTLFLLCTPVFAEENTETIDLDLDKAVIVGVNNNYDLKYNQIEQLLSKKIIRENWRLFLPTFSIDYGNSYSVTAYEPDSRTHSLKFKVSQPVYQGGRYLAAYRVSQIDYKIKSESYRLLLNDIKASVQKQYFSVIIKREVVNIQKRSVEQMAEQIKFAREENRLGMLTTIDLAEIEARGKQTELDLIKAINDMAQEFNALKKVLYLDYHYKLAITDNVINNYEYFPLNKNLEELIYSSYEMRQDLINTYSELIKKYYDYQNNKYYYLPSVSLNFDYTLSGEHFYPFNRSWNVGLQFDFLFGGSTLSDSGNYGESINTGGKSISSSHTLTPFADVAYSRRYLQAEAEYKTIKVKLDQLKQDIAIEMEDKYSLLNENWKMLEILKDRQQVLKKRFDIYEIKLKLGEAKRVDVTEAEVEYYKSMVEYIQGLLSYINSAVDLELALGTEIGSLQIIKKKTN